MTRAMLVLAAVAAVLILVAVMLFGYVNGVRNEGLQMETGLTAQYQDNQNYLSAFTSGFYEQVGLAQAQSETLDQILTDAVKGRYDKEGFGKNSPMVLAIAEAYPEAGVAELMANWGKIQTYISSERNGYRNQQSKLLDMIRAYELWRTQGLVHNVAVKMLGFPSDQLQARIGQSKETGTAALEQMYLIVTTEEVNQAYHTGTMEPLQVPTNK